MSTLYGLTGQWLELYNMMDDEEGQGDAILDTIEGIEMELEEKAEKYAYIIRQLEADAEAYKKEADRLTAKRKTAENAKERLKNSLYASMKVTEKYKFKSGVFSFSIAKNPPSVILDSEEIPERFLIPQEPKVDKNAIKEILNTGEKLVFAHLESGESLRIR